jgi:hypothetical protein
VIGTNNAPPALQAATTRSERFAELKDHLENRRPHKALMDTFNVGWMFTASSFPFSCLHSSLLFKWCHCCTSPPHLLQRHCHIQADDGAAIRSCSAPRGISFFQSCIDDVMILKLLRCCSWMRDFDENMPPTFPFLDYCCHLDTKKQKLSQWRSNHHTAW